LLAISTKPPLGPIAAALITAFFGCIFLVIAKSSKVSELRQEWINSFRVALSEFVSAADLISGRIGIRHKHSGEALSDDEVKLLETELIEYWEKLRRSHALVLLHMKNTEVGSKIIEKQIEDKLDEIVAKLRQGYKSINNADLLILRDALIVLGRKLLKDEWDRIKKGELGYRLALSISFVLLLVVLIGFPIWFFWPEIKVFFSSKV
jgi:hypothetical protein